MAGFEDTFWYDSSSGFSPSLFQITLALLLWCTSHPRGLHSGSQLVVIRVWQQRRGLSGSAA